MDELNTCILKLRCWDDHKKDIPPTKFRMANWASFVYQMLVSQKDKVGEESFSKLIDENSRIQKETNISKDDFAHNFKMFVVETNLIGKTSSTNIFKPWSAYCTAMNLHINMASSPIGLGNILKHKIDILKSLGIHIE